jgi:transcription antitermination protein NusB
MSARTKARKRALDILFESEARGLSPGETLTERIRIAEPPVHEYTITVVEGVAAHLSEIDAVLAERAEGWTLARMPAVDRTILRIGAFEVLHKDDVPDAVAISEAVGLARELSTDESPGFVNGLLAAVVRDKADLPG